jgi:Aspartyl/asparaginyl-tRNA synthetases
MRTLVRELKEKVGQEVTLYLTLEVLRDQKHLQFILGHDKSGTIQLVIPKSKVQNHEEIGQLLTGSTFIAQGLIVEAKQSKTFGLEMQVERIEIMSKSQAWPITEESSIDLRFDYRVVDLKSAKSQLMLKLRSAFEAGCREYLYSKEMTEIHTPKLMGTASESGSQVFRVEYFGSYAYLAQSNQFFKEAAVASGLEGVFEIAPVFRAEASHSTRHLTEFTGLDVEFAWCFEVHEVMKLEEEMLIHALSKLEPFVEKVKEIYGIELTTKPTVRYLSLDEAKDILKEKGFKLGKTQDLPDEGERILYEILGTDLIFVHDYPIAKRPFYHMWDRENGTTKSFDLIFKGIEITSGAIREHRLDVVSQQTLEKGVSLESVSYYLDNFKYGCAPHGGFGLGIERVIAKLLGLSSVKEASFMPRDPDRLTP